MKNAILVQKIVPSITRSWYFNGNLTSGVVCVAAYRSRFVEIGPLNVSFGSGRRPLGGQNIPAGENCVKKLLHSNLTSRLTRAIF